MQCTSQQPPVGEKSSDSLIKLIQPTVNHQPTQRAATSDVPTNYLLSEIADFEGSIDQFLQKPRSSVAATSTRAAIAAYISVREQPNDLLAMNTTQQKFARPQGFQSSLSKQELPMSSKQSEQHLICCVLVIERYSNQDDKIAEAVQSFDSAEIEIIGSYLVVKISSLAGTQNQKQKKLKIELEQRDISSQQQEQATPIKSSSQPYYWLDLQQFQTNFSQIDQFLKNILSYDSSRGSEKIQGEPSRVSLLSQQDISLSTTSSSCQNKSSASGSYLIKISPQFQQKYSTNEVNKSSYCVPSSSGACSPLKEVDYQASIRQIKGIFRALESNCILLIESDHFQQIFPLLRNIKADAIYSLDLHRDQQSYTAIKQYIQEQLSDPLEDFSSNNCTSTINEQNQRSSVVSVSTYSSEQLDNKVRNHIDNLRVLSECQYIGRIQKVFKVGNQFKIVTECLAFSRNLTQYTLEQITHTNNENSIKQIANQILIAMVQMHSLGIIHRSIHPDSIIIDSETVQIKLLDISSSVRVTKQNFDEVNQIRGTPGYIDPIFFQTKHQGKQITKQLSQKELLKTDMFGLGALLYYLLSGHALVKGDTEQEILQNSRSFQYNKAIIFKLELQQRLSIECLQFIACLLRPHPRDRPTAQECLDHPWFRLSSNPSKKEKDQCPKALHSLVEEHKQRLQSTKQFQFTTQKSDSPRDHIPLPTFPQIDFVPPPVQNDNVLRLQLPDSSALTVPQSEGQVPKQVSKVVSFGNASMISPAQAEQNSSNPPQQGIPHEASLRRPGQHGNLLGLYPSFAVAKAVLPMQEIQESNIEVNYESPKELKYLQRGHEGDANNGLHIKVIPMSDGRDSEEEKEVEEEPQSLSPRNMANENDDEDFFYDDIRISEEYSHRVLEDQKESIYSHTITQTNRAQESPTSRTNVEKRLFDRLHIGDAVHYRVCLAMINNRSNLSVS